MLGGLLAHLLEGTSNFSLLRLAPTGEKLGLPDHNVRVEASDICVNVPVPTAGKRDLGGAWDPDHDEVRYKTLEACPGRSVVSAVGEKPNEQCFLVGELAWHDYLDRFASPRTCNSPSTIRLAAAASQFEIRKRIFYPDPTASRPTIIEVAPVPGRRRPIRDAAGAWSASVCSKASARRSAPRSRS